VTAAGPSTPELLDEAVAGNRTALARLLSVAERGGEPAAELAALTHDRSGRAHTVGVTGAPGAGKSTLTSALCAEIRRTGDRVAVLAVDPSSPFSGGAILGDRVRMGDHATDPGVFIRSMATRGQLGGLSVATPAAIRVLDAVGIPWILVETVGVGQVEVAIAGAADTTVVVVNPGWGDAVQANKAGLMEIADVFVVNKADRPGAGETVRDLHRMLSLAVGGSWTPPVIETTATTGVGAADLWAAIQEHQRHSTASGELAERRAQRTREEIRALATAELERRAGVSTAGDRFDALVADVLAHRTDPLHAALALLDGDRPVPG
jgi:LAO/AO transport system kinase